MSKRSRPKWSQAASRMSTPGSVIVSSSTRNTVGGIPGSVITNTAFLAIGLLLVCEEHYVQTLEALASKEPGLSHLDSVLHHEWSAVVRTSTDDRQAGADGFLQNVSSN